MTNAPSSPDCCQYILFDLEQRNEISRWEPETARADDYTFDTDYRAIYLIREGEEWVDYKYEGVMIDRETWQHQRISVGDLQVIQSALALVFLNRTQ